MNTVKHENLLKPNVGVCVCEGMWELGVATGGLDRTSDEL